MDDIYTKLAETLEADTVAVTLKRSPAAATH